MNIALLSDIHGNLTALTAVLQDLRAQGADHIIMAGDYVSDGPQPDGVLDTIAGLKSATLIKGNREEYMLKNDEGAAPEWREFEQLGALLWTYRQLSRSHLGLIRSLQAQAVVKMEGADPIRVVHGSPFDISELLFPDKHPERIERALGMTDEPVLVCGHTHEAWSKRFGSRLVINPGSVGLHFNCSRGAEYAMLRWMGAEWSAEHREVRYDLDQVERQMKESRLAQECPVWSKAVMTALRTGRNVPIEFLKFAARLAEEEGLGKVKLIPNEIWAKADALWEWE